MATNFSVSMKPDGLKLSVMSENQGNVPAHDVRFEIIIDDTVSVSPVVKILGVHEKTAVETSLADVLEYPGRYPLIIRTYYKDASGHLFSALTAGYFDYKSTVEPAVFITGRATEIPVDGKGKLAFMLRNDEPGGQKVELELYIPNELSVSREYAAVELGPHQETTIVYDVENFSALANSSYQVALVGRYESSGIHLGAVGSAVVQIPADVESVDQPIWIWLVLGGVLPGIIIFLRLQKQ